MGPLRLTTPLRRLAFVALAFASACGDSSGSANSSGSPASPGGGLLFVLSAPTARLERDASGNGRLVLEDALSSVTSFTDRPERSASALALAEFVANWSRYGFVTDPPNAALVVDGASATADVAVFELAAPHLANGALTFDVVPLAGTPSAGVRALSERADPSLPSELGRVSLFVDDASSASSWQQVVLQITNAQPGQAIRIALSAPSAAVSWSLGPPDDRAPGFSLTCEPGSPLPLSQMMTDPQNLVFFTSSNGGGASLVEFQVSTYLVASGPVSVFSLASNSDPGVTVTAAIGNGSPVVLDQAATDFAWGD